MIKHLIYIFLFFSTICIGQESSFDKMIDNTLQKTVPFISSTDLKNNFNEYTILDSRELKEYKVSHLENSIWVGYDDFNIHNVTKDLKSNKPIVVYCSIGYRSEKIGEKLVKKGYQVYNLYGGIFDWKNKGNTVINNLNTSTNQVHCYNEDWSKWLLKGEKIYD